MSTLQQSAVIAVNRRFDDLQQRRFCEYVHDIERLEARRRNALKHVQHENTSFAEYMVEQYGCPDDEP